MAKRTQFILVFAAIVLLGGCSHPLTPKGFEESVEVPGVEEGSWVEVDVETLNYGEEQYMLYCYACHGENGDGRGPAARWLRPPPRDFRIGSFKFGKVVDGLPHDEDLVRIIKDGLAGTPMLPWDIPERSLNAIVQYIKTFSAEGFGYADEDARLGARQVAKADPWKGKEQAAIAKGEQIYHAYECWSCHPAYVTEAAISDASKAVKGTGRSTFRPNLYLPEPKTSAVYSVPIPNATKCDPEGDGSECTENQKCTMSGECEHKLKILPTDFTMNAIRAGSTVPDLFSTISAGIPGSGMPAWTIPEEERWAVAHYVNHLSKMYGNTTAAIAKKNALRNANKKK